ncbi:16029_t:CDS:2 [Rhizophagus irregularis]|nr:16029_t:CDS:2 [Rhizophagus irregularis]
MLFENLLQKLTVTSNEGIHYDVLEVQMILHQMRLSIRLVTKVNIEEVVSSDQKLVKSGGVYATDDDGRMGVLLTNTSRIA